MAEELERKYIKGSVDHFLESGRYALFVQEAKLLLARAASQHEDDARDSFDSDRDMIIASSNV